MPGEVQSQVDVGALSRQGLGAFTEVLNAITADSVAANALLEVKSLGDLFHTNGKLAERVKTELQRSSNLRFDRFALLCGWRKGDSFSYMADYAGGQAGALLCLCLMETLEGRKSNVGLVLSQLCSEFLSREMNICGVPHLADFAESLAGKLVSLDFGSLVVEQGKKIKQCYHNLEKQPPETLMEGISVDSTVHLLVLIARAFQREDSICHIRGFASMAKILALVQAMFPLHTTITIEGIMLQSASNADVKIYCEIVDNKRTSHSTEVFIQKSVSHFDKRTWINTVHAIESQSMSCNTFVHFKWHGWLANRLQLIFLNHKVRPDDFFTQAFCDLLTLIPGDLKVLATVPPLVARREGLEPTPIVDLLGPMPRVRIAMICQEILGCTPSAALINLEQAIARFEGSVTAMIANHPCSCNKSYSCKGKGLKFWLETSQNVAKCSRLQIWRSLIAVLSQGVLSFFINAGPNTTICDALNEDIPSYITSVLAGYTNRNSINVNDLMSSIMSFALGREVNRDEVWASSSCSTVYPSVLESIAVPTRQSATFELVDGRLIYENRYHSSILAEVPSRTRPKARKPLACEMAPSHIGRADENPGMNGILIREGATGLAVSFNIYNDGNVIPLDLKSVLVGYLGMRWTQPCPHRYTDTMDVTKRKAISTSVTAPSAFGKLGVVMTRGSPSSQFMCCEDGYQAVLQNRSCLNCAAEPYPSQNAVVIIVT